MRTSSVTTTLDTVREEGTIDAESALAQLYADQYAGLVRLGVLLVRDQELAEDVVQDSFVAVYRHWHRIEEATAVAYLRTTVVNTARSALRRRSVAARHRVEEQPVAPGADETTLRTERRQAVLDALATLPARQREVLVLRYYLDLSERDIAATLGISQGAVKSHASRGGARLRTLLQEEER